ncbi:MAG TPA: SufD family Fe-S cluster assembly protein, partial [Gemmatimonadales bacterium]|nr:SufD family Fe-S cluster assembly protein [Gemmatimonadales bacterium]
MSEAYLQEFGSRAPVATAETPDWLESVRKAAIDRFAATGFPTARDEEWRFTPIAPIVQGTWSQGSGLTPGVTLEQLAPFIFGHPEWTTLVFVDGGYSKALSSTGKLPPGVRAGSLAEALRADGVVLEKHLARHASIQTSPFTALSTAFMRDGGFLHVPANIDLTRPVHLVFVATAKAAGSVTHPRNLVVIERGARASVIESYVSLAEGASYWTNAVTEVVAGANSWIEHTRIQR